MVEKKKSLVSLWWRRCRLKIKSWILSRLGKNISAVLVSRSDKSHIYLCDPLDNFVSRQLLKNGCYNPAEVETLSSRLRPADSCLVLGGHIGSIAIPLSDCCHSIEVFEPNPSTYRLLDLNIKLNQIRNMTCHQIGAWSSSTEIEFVQNIDNSGGSKRLPRKFDFDLRYDDPQIIKVPVVAVDGYFDKNFDVVIMDIEGSEYEAIKGAFKILQSTRVFACEFFPRHLSDIAGVSERKFADLLIQLDFATVTFPKAGITGKPQDILLSTFQLITERSESEDLVIFER